MKKFILLFIIVFVTNMVQAKAALTLGVVPQQSASNLAKVWVQLAMFLSKKTGENIRFSTSPDVLEFEKRVAAGTYDIVYLNPYHYTVFSKYIGLQAIARKKTK